MTWLYILALIIVIALTILAAVPFSAGRADNEGSPIFGEKTSAGHPQWEMVGGSHEAGNLDGPRGIPGTALSMRGHLRATLPFPDGTVLINLAWKHVPSVAFDGAFVPGPSRFPRQHAHRRIALQSAIG